MQQINLYQPIFRPQKQPLSAKTMLVAGGALLFALLLFQAYAVWQQKALDGQIEALEQVRAERLAQIATLAERHPERARSESLERANEQLRQEVARKRAILSEVGQQVEGNAEGFAPLLEGLSRRRPDDLWLTGVVLQQGGREMEVAGIARRPEQIPRYLQALAGEPAFSGRAFERLRIQRREDEAGVEFAVGTGGVSE